MPKPISGAVRISVEVLLYYAPQIVNTGTTLASAVATAQRQLLDLGDFFGKSWPDQPFRDSYPRSQYAMLILANQLADEIQGIGRGIEQMARIYGITESQNTAAILGIEELTAGMDLAGRLPQPPDTPLKLALPSPQSSHPTPSAQPNPPPSPPAAMPTSSPSPTPDPQPEVDPTTWHAGDGAMMLGPWPGGDPGRMEEAARCWNSLTSSLDGAWSGLQFYKASILADTQGPAADAFNNYVDGLIATGHGSLTRAIQTSQDLHDVCLQQATEIRSLKRTLEEAGAELLAVVIITQAISALTFESTQALSDVIDAGLATRLTALAEHFVRFSERLVEILKTSVVGLSKVVAAAVASGVQSGVIGEADLEANNIIGLAFGQEPATGATALLDFLKNFGLGFFIGQGSAGGLLGLSAAAASKKLIDLGETLKDSAGSDGKIGQLLIALGRQLKDGSITVSAANSAATDLITNGKVTPVAFFSDAFSNRLITLLSPNTGKHVAH